MELAHFELSPHLSWAAVGLASWMKHSLQTTVDCMYLLNTALWWGLHCIELTVGSGGREVCLYFRRALKGAIWAQWWLFEHNDGLTFKNDRLSGIARTSYQFQRWQRDHISAAGEQNTTIIAVKAVQLGPSQQILNTLHRQKRAKMGENSNKYKQKWKYRQKYK